MIGCRSKTRPAALRFGSLGGAIGVLAALAPAPVRAQPALQPPPGNVLSLSTTGVGTQNYICLPATKPGAPSFRPTGPQSALSVSVGATLRLEVAENILAAVPGQASTPSPGCVEAAGGQQQLCPAWRSPLDLSAVYGTTIATVMAGAGPSCPDTSAIPCLLLRTLAVTQGRGKPNLLGAVTYVRRLQTTGGSAPKTACTVGQIVQVPYTATYEFYTARP